MCYFIDRNAALQDNSKQFVHMEESEMEAVLARIKDSNLRHTLSFGINMQSLIWR